MIQYARPTAYALISDKERQFICPSLEGREILHDFVQQGDAGGFLGFISPRGEDDLLELRCPDQRREPLILAADRQLPSVRAIGNPNFAGLGADVQEPARGDAGAVAGASAVDCRNGRHPALFERGQHAIAHHKPTFGVEIARLSGSVFFSGP